MLIKLTNNSPNMIGEPLYVNTDWIVSVFENATEGGSLQTVVYGGPSGISWVVEESPAEIAKLIKEQNK